MVVEFTEINFRKIRIPLRIPFSHGKFTHRVSEPLLVDIRTRNGARSTGEVQCRAYLTGESHASAQAFIQDVLWPRFASRSFRSMQESWQLLQTLHDKADRGRHLAAFCGFEWAVMKSIASEWNTRLEDFFWKEFEKPRELRGHISAKARCLSALPLLPAPISLALGGLLKSIGVNSLKVKVAPKTIAHSIANARRARLWTNDVGYDANGSLTLANWRDCESELSLPAFIEQPTDKSDEACWREIQDRTRSVVIADESLCTTDDAKRLLDNEGCGGWNLRLAKIGGFSGLLRHLNLSGSRPLTLHLGSLVGETAILSEAFQIAQNLYSFDRTEASQSHLLIGNRKP